MSTGDYGFSKDYLFPGQIPDLLVMGIVKGDSFHGDLKSNPFNFIHGNLKFLSIAIDGQPKVKPLKLNYSKGMCTEAYYYMQLFLGKVLKGGGVDIQLQDFANGYALYVFDLAQDQSGLDWVASPPTRSSLRIEGSFSEPTTQTLEVVCLGMFINTVEIDYHRNVQTDFGS